MSNDADIDIAMKLNEDVIARHRETFRTLDHVFDLNAYGMCFAVNCSGHPEVAIEDQDKDDDDPSKYVTVFRVQGMDDLETALGVLDCVVSAATEAFSRKALSLNAQSREIKALARLLPDDTTTVAERFGD